MRNHFQSARRWDYIIISTIGSGHRHYIISNSVDANSLYSVKDNYDSKYDGFVVINQSGSDSCSLYNITSITDKPGYYSINNPVNKGSLFVIYNRGDFNR